jgi:hypothetical protein
MYIDKISLKITPFQWFGLYQYLFGINHTVTEALQSRHSVLPERYYILFDLCQTQTNTTSYQRWSSREPSKLYTMHLPIGQAVALVSACFHIDYVTNPPLHSFIGSLYARLTIYVSPHQFHSPVDISKPLLATTTTEHTCSGHECFSKRTGSKCIICKNQ